MGRQSKGDPPNGEQPRLGTASHFSQEQILCQWHTELTLPLIFLKVVLVKNREGRPGDLAQLVKGLQCDLKDQLLML